MSATQEMIPSNPNETGVMIAEAFLDQLDRYRSGEESVFFGVFCPGDGTTYSDIGLELFLDKLDIEDINTESDFLVLSDGIKLHFCELADAETGKIYHISFSSEQLTT